MKFLRLALAILVVSACMTPKESPFDGEAVPSQSRIRVCITNASTDVYRIYFRNTGRGSITQNQSRWITLPASEYVMGTATIVARNVTGSRDTVQNDITLRPGVTYVWELTDNYIMNSISLKPKRGRTRCD